MNYSIAYISRTGNTALLAEKIKAALGENCVYCGQPCPNAAKADMIFAGFFADKGTCSEEMAVFLKALSNKKVFLFGTAGFGGSDEYFNRILQNVKASINNSNEFAGSFMCQGKMPPAVRAKYEALAQQSPEKAKPMLDNFDKALAHPHNEDLQALEKLLKLAFEKNNAAAK